ncbi:MAG: Lrp/AsnC family transcriptional regulator [Primorskyibacter sp.]
MQDVDKAILRVLQKDCSQSLAQISAQVDASVTTCHRRIKALETRGVIRSRRAILNTDALGYAVTGVFMLRLASNGWDVAQRVQDRMSAEPTVVSCYLATGEYDLIMTARFRTAADYKDYAARFMNRYADLSIAQVTSSLVLQTIRENGGIPV